MMKNQTNDPLALLSDRVRLTKRLPSPEVARAIRRAAGVSQEGLAGALGVSRQAVGYWEAGQLSLGVPDWKPM